MVVVAFARVLRPGGGRYPRGGGGGRVAEPVCEGGVEHQKAREDQREKEDPVAVVLLPRRAPIASEERAYSRIGSQSRQRSEHIPGSGANQVRDSACRSGRKKMEGSAVL